MTKFAVITCVVVFFNGFFFIDCKVSKGHKIEHYQVLEQNKVLIVCNLSNMNEDGRSDSSIETLDNLSLSEGDNSEQKTLPIILDKPTSPSPSEVNLRVI